MRGPRAGARLPSLSDAGGSDAPPAHGLCNHPRAPDAISRPWGSAIVSIYMHAQT